MRHKPSVLYSFFHFTFLGATLKWLTYNIQIRQTQNTMFTGSFSLHQTLAGHQNPIFAVERGMDANSIFTAGNDKGVVEWDLSEGKFKRILCSVPASVYTLHLLEDRGILVLGMRNGEVWCVDIAKQELIKKWKVESGAVFAIKSLSAKNELIAIGEEGYAYVWSLDSFDLLYRFKVSNTTVRTIEPHEETNQIAFGDKDGYIHLFDLEEFKEITKRQVHTMPVTSLMATETYLYSGGRDAQLYKLEHKDLANVQTLTPHMFTVYAIVAHPTLPVIATVSRDKSIKLWHKEDLRLLQNISIERGYEGHRLSINAAVWAGDQLITAGDDKLVKVWKVALV